MKANVLKSILILLVLIGLGISVRANIIDNNEAHYYIYDWGVENSITGLPDISLIKSGTTCTVSANQTSICGGEAVIVTYTTSNVVTAGADQGTAQFTTNGGTSWNNMTPNQSNQITYYPTSTTIYGTRVLNSASAVECGPNYTTVTVNPTPQNVNAGGNVSLCHGQSIQLLGSATAPVITGSCTQSSSVSGQDCNNIQTSVTINCAPAGAVITNIAVTGSIGPSCTSWYYYRIFINGTVQGGTRCDGTYSFVNFNGQQANGTTIRLQATDNDSYCDNITLGLSVTVSYSVPVPISFSWSGGPFVSGQNTATPAVNPTTTTTYTMTVSTADCSVQDVAEVTVLPSPGNPTTVTSNPSSINNGESSNLSAISAGNTIRWWTAESGGALLGTSNSGANFSVSPSITTTYWAETYDGSCPSVTRVPVTVNVLYPYVAEFVSFDYDPAEWCRGEERIVSVTIKNVGTETWNTGGVTTNVGIRWNEWADYHLRTSAGAIAPGEEATYEFSIIAKNAVAGPVYGVNLAAGSNNLRVDVVNEGQCWFGNNNGICGPGNIAFVSPAITIKNTSMPESVLAGTDITICEGEFVQLNAIVSLNECLQQGTGNAVSPSCNNPSSTNCTDGDYIGNFSTSGGIVNITSNNTGCSPNGYIDYSTRIVEVNAGNSFNISVQAGGSYSQGFRIWIDWNNDGVFQAGESVWSGGVGTGVYTGTIAVPAGQAAGVYRMRVRCQYNAIPDVDACASITYSEVEDYRIRVNSFSGPCPESHFNYSWIPTASLSDASIHNPIASPIITTNYTITASNQGCEKSDNVTVFVNPAPTAPTNVQASLEDICIGEESNLSAISLGNDIQWWDSETHGSLYGISASGADFPVSPTVTTTYWAASYDSNNCSSLDRVPVNILFKPSSVIADGIQASSLAINPGESVQLSVIGGFLGYNAEWQWFEDDCDELNLIGTGAVLNIEPNTSTNYFVRASGECNTTDCVSISIFESQYDACNTIYVSDAGNDSFNGNSDFPLKTIAKAMSLVTPTRNHIKVAEGNYIMNQRLKLLDNLIIDGSYIVSGANWTKSSDANTHFHFEASTEGLNPTVTSESNDIRHIIGVVADGTSDWTLQDLIISSDDINGMTVSGRGSSNYVLWLNNCSDYNIVRCEIISGNASNGQSGVTPAGIGGAFGNGGNGAPAGNNTGSPGFNGGTLPGGAIGGIGGSGGSGCSGGCRAGNGSPGNPGANGLSYVPGDRPTSNLISGQFYIPSAQAENGEHGGGGAGGGGGGGSASYGLFCDGMSGGNGGRGGNGGVGGTGGFGGGGSFGIWSFNSNVNANLDGLNIVLGSPGAGGIGGNGTVGLTGLGGQAGDSNSGLCSSANGGGTGGAGGKGGDGGRGRDGANGLAFGIVEQGVGTNYSVPIPTTPLVMVDNKTINVCNNSEITILKASGVWSIPSGISFVNNINSSSSSYNTSSASAVVIAENANEFYSLISPIDYKGFIKTVNNNRDIPVIYLSDNLFCSEFLPMEISLSADVWGNETAYDWRIFTTNANNPIFLSNEQSPIFNISSLAAGVYNIRYRVYESCCGWSAPVYESFEINIAPSSPQAIVGNTAVCESDIAILEAIGGTEGSGCIYEWGTGEIIGDNIIFGETGPVLTTLPLTETTHFWVRRIGTSLCIGYTDAATILVNVYGANCIIWTGAVNTDWNNQSNWSLSVVPTFEHNVIIPSNYLHPPVVYEDKASPAVCGDLNITSGAVFTIASNKAITVFNSIFNNGTFNIKSAAGGDASLLVYNGISGNGIYNVERFLTGNMWHLVTSPITNGLAGVFEDIWLRPYDESTNTFGAYIIPIVTPMPTGQGFSVWTFNADETRTFTGTINDGNIGPLPIQLTGAPSNETGWNLIGNPYTSAIDWDSPLGWNKNSIANAIYVWNNNQYATYINGISTHEGSNYIAMGQGFFVQATNPGASIAMNNPIRVHNEIAFKNHTIIPDLLRVRVEGNYYYDECVLYKTEGAVPEYDFQNDAAKLYGIEDAPQIYTKKGNSPLSVHSINSIDDLIGKNVFLHTGASAGYNLIFNHSFETNHILLKDLFTGLLIQSGEEYSFESSPADQSQRFEFVSLPTELARELSSSISAWSYNNILYVSVPENEKIHEIRIFNMLGSVVLYSDKDQTDLSLLAPGVYLADIETDRQMVVRKIVVQ